MCQLLDESYKELMEEYLLGNPRNELPRESPGELLKESLEKYLQKKLESPKGASEGFSEIQRDILEQSPKQIPGEYLKPALRRNQPLTFFGYGNMNLAHRRYERPPTSKSRISKTCGVLQPMLLMRAVLKQSLASIQT